VSYTTKRMRNNIANTSALWMGCLFLSGCMTLPGAQSKTVDGAQVEYAVQGHGQPVIVFESGLGDGMDSWGQVFPEVSSFATVFAYNRAGYGKASRASTVRDGAHIVEELRALLNSAGLQPPYVLVGHSLGGTYLQLFARLHPTEVSGMVLVEARAESMTRRCREAKLFACDPPKWLVAAMAGPASAEYAATRRRARVDDAMANHTSRACQGIATRRTAQDLA
jgi:pimeloyl-ACP methyl ester carboxylesterase